MRILAVSGSLREDSFNTSLLRAALEAAPEGVELELWEGIGELPFYDQDLDGDAAPESVRRLREDWAAADAILFSTPEYNGSVPGGLKNAIDWASRPYGQNAFARKPTAVIGTSPGKIGTAIAQSHLRSILAFCNAPLMNSVEAYIQFEPGVIGDDGEVTKEETKTYLRDFMAEFAGYVARVYTVLPRTS